MVININFILAGTVFIARWWYSESVTRCKYFKVNYTLRYRFFLSLSPLFLSFVYV